MKGELYLWIMDVQRFLAPAIFGIETLKNRLSFLIRGATALEIPILVTEQYPQGLGETIPEITALLPPDTPKLAKTSFSGWRDLRIAEFIKGSKKKHWVLAGIETHICLFQTAKDLYKAGFEVTILQDCVGSRRTLDHHSALTELDKLSLRLTTAETLLYELVESKESADFKKLLTVMKNG